MSLVDPANFTPFTYVFTLHVEPNLMYCDLRFYARARIECDVVLTVGGESIEAARMRKKSLPFDH
jgi:hypothetical protein